jgi:N-acetylneuraminate synthase/sialic acid synthase
MLKYAAELQKPMLISTGGGTLEDVQRAYDAVMPINSQVCLLQCTATYPTAAEDMNLRVISTFREHFPDVVIGLSDHYNGIAMAVVAYMLGARLIEKHFTMNHTWKGTDHALSLEPIGMHKMVRDLRRTRISLGDGIKQTHLGEADAVRKMGKKLVAKRDLQFGHILTEEDIAIKSPGDGLPPYELERVLGHTLRQPLKMDENIRFEILDVEDISPVLSENHKKS